MKELAIEENFPELKESEDERIRKEIIAFLTYYHTGQGNSVKYDDGWIAWLEKQGEQKPAWSEEDEKYLKLAIDNFQTLGNSFLTAWLKSLYQKLNKLM